MRALGIAGLSALALGVMISAARAIEPLGPQPGCISSDEASAFVKDLGIDTHAFDASGNLCDSKRELNQLLEAIRIVSEGKFASTPKSALVPGFISADYASYLRQNLNSVTAGQSCESGVVGYVMSGTHVMNICPLFFDPRVSIMKKMGTLVHETRHTQGYPHVTCESGIWKGRSGACDAKYAEGGAYGVEAEYYSRIALNGMNFHPVLQYLARTKALELLFTGNFNSTSFARQAQLLLADRPDGRLMIWDGVRLSEGPSAAIGGDRIVNHDGLGFGELIPAVRSDPPRYFDYYSLQVYPQDDLMRSITGMVLWDFGHSWDTGARADLVDLLTPSTRPRNALVQLNRSAIFYDLPGLAQGAMANLPESAKPERLLSVLPCRNGNALVTGVFVRFASGEIDQIDISSGEDGAPTVRLTNTGCAWPGDLVDISALGDQLYVLDDQGRVSTLLAGGTRQAVSGLAARRFSQLTVITRLPDLANF